MYTAEDKAVADYAGIAITAVGDLDMTDYYIYRHDAVVHNLQKTQAGREYLENCWILQQDKPDRKRLRERFGKA